MIQVNGLSLEAEPPSTGHSIPCVQSQVEDHLLDLAPVRLDVPDARMCVYDDRYLFAERAAKDRDKVVNDFIEIDYAGAQ
jgi:hypothetical protein